MEGEIKSAKANFVVVIKKYRFFVFHCSYRKQGDLSTSLEMTVIFSIVIQSVSEACHSEGIQCPKKLLGRVYLLERTPIYGEVCYASEVFLRKVKFVYDK